MYILTFHDLHYDAYVSNVTHVTNIKTILNECCFDIVL